MSVYEDDVEVGDKVPTADTANNISVRDVIGNKTDTTSGNSLVALTKVVDGVVDGLATSTGQIVSKTYADLAGYDTADAFTVTGDVMVRVIGVVGVTGITSTAGTSTLSVGTTESAAGIIAASTMDNAQFAATDVWTDSSPANDVDTLASAWFVIGGSANIVLTRNVDDITAGTLTLYCEWKPLSTGATLVSA